jgi:hypothetical protein
VPLGSDAEAGLIANFVRVTVAGRAELSSPPQAISRLLNTSAILIRHIFPALDGIEVSSTIRSWVFRLSGGEALRDHLFADASVIRITQVEF